MADAYPLQWPEGWPRTAVGARRSAKYKVTSSRAVSEAMHSLELAGKLHPDKIGTGSAEGFRELGLAREQAREHFGSPIAADAGLG